MKNLSLKICLMIAALLASVGSGFASDLPACPSSGYKHNCFGTFTSANGDKYVGEYKDNKRNGQGTLTSANGDKYVGEHRDDKIHGQGTLTFADGDKYVGEFRDDKIHGQGTFTLASGDKYVGEIRDDNLHGQGTLTYATGDKYVGEWRVGERHGQGTLTYATGDKYVGEWRVGERHGQGTLTSANGDKYVGEHRDDKIHGQGTFTWANGDKYVGEWKDNKRNGQGTYTFANGDKYVGEFKDNKRNGQGIKTYVNGFAEEGFWKDGKFQFAKKVTPPVPKIKKPTQNDEIISASSGSGFAVSSDGYVITNHHVIDGCQKVVVHTKGKELPVTVVTYDPQNDLALLKGDFRPKTVFPLSNNRPELLQDIYVAGFPFGDKFSTSVKVTKGIISSLTGLGNNFSNIQIDAALQSGNSGGPILDDLGNVVGVAVSKLDAKYMFEEFGVIPENTNFGIKSSVVRSVLDSNSVDSLSANKRTISKSQLGEMISSGTYYISCWMTMAQIEKMKTKKVFFSNLD
jgi:hypothetical protein